MCPCAGKHLTSKSFRGSCNRKPRILIYILCTQAATLRCGRGVRGAGSHLRVGCAVLSCHVPGRASLPNTLLVRFELCLAANKKDGGCDEDGPGLLFARRTVGRSSQAAPVQRGFAWLTAWPPSPSAGQTALGPWGSPEARPRVPLAGHPGHLLCTGVHVHRWVEIHAGGGCSGGFSAVLGLASLTLPCPDPPDSHPLT